MQKMFEQARPSLVEVISRKSKGAGVILSSRGHVVTSIRALPKGSDKVSVRIGQTELEAKILLVDDETQMAVLALPETTEYPTAAVRLEAKLSRGAWMIGLERTKKGQASAKLGRLKAVPSLKQPLLKLDFELAPGSPVLDGTGKVIGVAVGKGSKSNTAVPVDRLKEKLSSVLAVQVP
jgi:S1-C subfamily serine protease